MLSSTYLLEEEFINQVYVIGQVCQLFVFSFQYALPFLFFEAMRKMPTILDSTYMPYKIVLGFACEKLNCTMSIEILQLQSKNYAFVVCINVGLGKA